ncbi:hypothetical protein [Paenibacillus sp. Marseille-Q7038]
MQNRTAWMILMVIVVALVVYVTYLYIPKTVYIDTNGIMYRNETENTLEKSLRVQIKGKVYREWVNKKYFRGDIQVEGQTFPVPREKASLIEIPVGFSTPTSIVYSFIWPEQEPGLYQYGSISMNDNYTEAVILVSEKREPSEAEIKQNVEDTKGWSFDNGLMIAVPAKNREEAVALTNEILYSYTGIMGLLFK